MMQKAQDLITVWAGEKTPVHGSNEGLSFVNVVNNDNVDGGATGNGDAQASGGQEKRGDVPETRRCHCCKKGGHINPNCLKLKAKRAAEEAENAASSGAVKTGNTKDGAGKHAHTMLVDGFGSKDRLLFS